MRLAKLKICCFIDQSVRFQFCIRVPSSMVSSELRDLSQFVNAVLTKVRLRKNGLVVVDLKEEIVSNVVSHLVFIPNALVCSSSKCSIEQFELGSTREQ